MGRNMNPDKVGRRSIFLSISPSIYRYIWTNSWAGTGAGTQTKRSTLVGIHWHTLLWHSLHSLAYGWIRWHTLTCWHLFIHLSIYLYSIKPISKFKVARQGEMTINTSTVCSFYLYYIQSVYISLSISLLSIYLSIYLGC